MSDAHDLLPHGVEMPFADIAAALVHGGEKAVRMTPPRALTATIVAVGPAQRLAEAAGVLQRLGARAAVRTILISEGSESRPTVRIAEDTVALAGLKASFIDNAVAALRLSSLPTLVWWRGGSPAVLDDLARLADRIVLDDAEPRPVWARAVELFDRTAFSDLRWTRLTRWRALMAHFFDIPEVRVAASRFDALDIKGNDRIAASLFAAWLDESLGRAGAIRVTHVESPRGVFLEEVRLSNTEEVLTIELGRSGACILTSSEVHGHNGAARMVPVGDQSDNALLDEELQIRVRDLAFERAVKRALS